MITVATTPRVGERVQAGATGRIVGTLVGYGGIDSGIAVVAGPTGREHRCLTTFLFLLSDRLVSIPDPDNPTDPPLWEGPLERTGGALNRGSYEATSEPDDGLTHTGYVDVPKVGVPTWTCADSCSGCRS